MKFLLDYFPLAIFVGVYFLSGAEKPMYPAVQALIIASAIQTIGYRIITGKFEKTHVWTFLITLVLGGMTLVLKDAAFIQWKATIVVWFFAGFFLFRQYISKKPLIKDLLENAIDETLEVPEKVWKRINLMWPIAFFLFGFLNLYIAFNFSEAFWVNFKLFGLFALNIILLVYTMFLLFPYFPEEENETSTSQGSSQESNSIKQKEILIDEEPNNKND